jgi:hypothetical protein
MPNRNSFPRRRCSFKVLADRVIEAELAFLDEQHDTGGDKLLIGRSDFGDGFRFERNFELESSSFSFLAGRLKAELKTATPHPKISSILDKSP